MNIGQVIQKVLDAIAAYKTGNKWQAGLILLQLVQEILRAMPAATVGTPRLLMAYAFDVSSATEDELVAELEKCCNQPMTGDESSVALDAPQGPVIAMLLPIILALLKKWLLG